ncbi:MAG: hypothetical protein J1F36_01200 [Clostridiales bacterium]|nr:hypothetical protein [Clostridiales bacterium]
MTKQRWIEVLSLVDEKYIIEADPFNNKAKPNFGWKRLGLLAASIGIFVAAVVLLCFKPFGINTPINPPTPPTPSTPTTPPTALEWGFSYGSGAPLPSDFCAYKSDKSEFDIDDVTFTIFFGSILDVYLDDDHKYGRNIPEFDIYFADVNVEMLYLIRHNEENYASEKYKCRIIDEADGSFKIEFNYSEEVTIPKELFTKEQGVIGFCVGGIDLNSVRKEYELLTCVYFNYDIVNDKVVLSKWDGYRK